MHDCVSQGAKIGCPKKTNESAVWRKDMLIYHLQNASVKISGNFGLKSLNVFLLLCVLFSNITGVAQARDEKNDISKSMTQDNPLVVQNVHNSPSFALPEPIKVKRASASLASSTTTYLSDLTWTYMTNGWGPAERDRSNGETGDADGHTITLNGVTYTKGLGVHAYSEIRYDISNLGYELFVSDIGLDDETCGSGSVIFKVYLDGVEKFNSGIQQRYYANCRR
jgi:hypothetical protein